MHALLLQLVLAATALAENCTPLDRSKPRPTSGVAVISPDTKAIVGGQPLNLVIDTGGFSLQTIDKSVSPVGLDITQTDQTVLTLQSDLQFISRFGDKPVEYRGKVANASLDLDGTGAIKLSDLMMGVVTPNASDESSTRLGLWQRYGGVLGLGFNGVDQDEFRPVDPNSPPDADEPLSAFDTLAPTLAAPLFVMSTSNGAQTYTFGWTDGSLFKSADTAWFPIDADLVGWQTRADISITGQDDNDDDSNLLLMIDTASTVSRFPSTWVETYYAALVQDNNAYRDPVSGEYWVNTTAVAELPSIEFSRPDGESFIADGGKAWAATKAVGRDERKLGPVQPNLVLEGVDPSALVATVGMSLLQDKVVVFDRGGLDEAAACAAVWIADAASA